MGNTVAYEKSELELMTTYQLREICRREKIMNGVIQPLDREELVHTIIRFIGKQQDLLIRSHEEDGKGRLEEFLGKTKIVYLPGEGLSCRSKILAYEGLSTEYYDGYTIPYRKELAGTNALLVGSDLAVCAVFNIVEHGKRKDRLYITRSAETAAREAERKDYRLFCMGHRLSEDMYHLYYGKQIPLPEHAEVYSIPIVDFVVKKPVTLMLPMAVDFGSVNTTAGVYLDSAYFESTGHQAALENSRENEISYTVFENGEEESLFLPSVVGVQTVEEDGYTLLFGHDAIRLATASCIDEGFCVFYDIKRWVADYDKEEEITDRQGRRRMVRRADILRRFFLYVIRKTENRFKCRITQVHISSPVRQKHYFRRMFREILPEYMADREVMLDEGMAVLYNTISGMMEQDTLEENEQYEALVIDCGGGTTDLCSCRFCIRDRHAAYKIHMETTYENGDTDFGGNNLTYRIMQLLKISLVRAETESAVSSVKEILEHMDTDIYRFVDTHGVRELYKYLDGEYRRAEKVLPTRFADFERYNRSEYYKVKNNFYTLFHAAEQVKKLFYGKTGALTVTVTPEPRDGDEMTVVLDKWKLSFYRQGNLEVKKAVPAVVFNYFETELLLSGEIYGIVSKFMEEMYQNGRLQDFSFIKLTGQSCRIGLFKDALKEFVPGRMVQFRKKAVDAGLKMACVDGALKYLRDRKYGLADICLDDGKAVLPYRITAYTHNGREVVLVDGYSDWEKAGTVSRNLEDLILPLYLKDQAGVEHCRFQYVCSREEFAQKSYEEIEAVYGSHIPQKETDRIENGDVKFFVWGLQEEWGIRVVPVCCRKDELYLGRAEFFSFENDSRVSSFFDGKK